MDTKNAAHTELPTKIAFSGWLVGLRINLFKLIQIFLVSCFQILCK
jgi:hypothetical protein